MKATGIVRRIDDLGRVVIPKEIRRFARLREGDPLEIFTDRNGEIILKKYSPVSALGDFAQEYANSLSDALGSNIIAIITDTDHVVAISGAPKKEFLHQENGTAIDIIMNQLKSSIIINPEIIVTDNNLLTVAAIAPIVVERIAIGTVALCSKQPGLNMGEMEIKLVETAAGFLARQMML